MKDSILIIILIFQIFSFTGNCYFLNTNILKFNVSLFCRTHDFNICFIYHGILLFYILSFILIIIYIIYNIIGESKNDEFKLVVIQLCLNIILFIIQWFFLGTNLLVISMNENFFDNSTQIDTVFNSLIYVVREWSEAEKWGFIHEFLNSKDIHINNLEDSYYIEQLCKKSKTMQELEEGLIFFEKNVYNPNPRPTFNNFWRTYLMLKIFFGF